MLQLLRCSRRLLPASVLALSASVLAVSAAPASAATVALGGRTFNQACTAATAGDTVTVPAGTYTTQTINCTKAVTFLAQGTVKVAYLDFNGANGPTVDGMTVTGNSGGGAIEVFRSSHVTVRNSTINNMVYFEGAVDATFDHNTHEPAAGGSSWSNFDMIDIYEQTRTAQANTNITISNSVFHGLRASTTSDHPDVIQFCDSDCGGAHSATGIKIVGNRFYDNECMNIRSNGTPTLLVEGNVFGDTYNGITGCGWYDIDVWEATATVRYNTFVGNQQAQISGGDVGQTQSWVGNVGVGMSTACGATRATYSHNIWTGQKCGATDVKVSSLKLNSDGTPQSGSPVIDAGDPSSYPSTDFNGASRFSGAAPDAGAFEFGATTGMPDTTPPETTIGSAPASGTSTSASVAFSSSESGSAFECQLDGGGYAACTSPKAYSGLAVGSHTVSVRATDAAGNVDATPATATWTISSPPADTTAPETTITSSPANGTSTNGAFAFSSSESGSTFECQLDGGGYAACTSPKSYTGVAAGSHTFNVRATDAAGNTDATPDTATWTVSAVPPADTTAPETTITSAPSDGTSTSASLAFSSSEAGSSFACKLDAGSYASCTSPKGYSGLAVGSHTVSVRATDAAGNVDATPDTATWTISAIPPADTTAPTVTISSKPTSGTTATTASLGFSATDDVTPAGSLTYRCKLDGGAYATCSSPKGYTGLAIGSHTFSVRATDAAGNQSTAVSATWTISAPDTTDPTVTITSRPSAVLPSLSSSATFAFTGADNVTPADALAFRCTLDGSAAEDCVSPETVTSLGLGLHTFTVTAVDAAGNASAAASATWTVIALPVPNAPTAPTAPQQSAPAPAPAPTTPQEPAPVAAPLIAPTLSLLKPTTGTRFRSTLKAVAAATDDGAVDHVEFWLDSKRFAYDTSAPYTATMSTDRVKAGAHTLVARAVDDQGLAASIGTAVERVTGASSASSKLVQVAATTGDESTELLATGPKSGKVAIGLTSCGDGQAKVVTTVTVQVGRSGRAGKSVPTAGLCVASVTLRK